MHTDDTLNCSISWGMCKHNREPVLYHIKIITHLNTI